MLETMCTYSGRDDLLIGNYVSWSPASEIKCVQDGVRGYCGPDAYRPLAPRLFRNQGGGRFEDVSARAGLNDPTDKAMGVAVVDYNVDGWPDLFIGSDRVPAKLYRTMDTAASSKTASVPASP